ncbi:MAG: aquaporin [Alphaproteobacteria bacterium]
MVFIILAIGDTLAKAQAAWLGPILVGFLVMVIGMSFGAMHGYAINPARDLGPRLLTVVAGFKNNGLTDGSLIWTVPVIGPIIGGILGAIIYDFTLGCTYKEQNAD